MSDDEATSSRDGWARLRFAIVGPLLASPPSRGALRAALTRLVAQTWRHPITRAPMSFAFPTIERWYYAARTATRDPVGVLRPRRRKDAGQPRAVSARVQLLLHDQSQAHPSWSYQLHLDNLAVVIAEDPTLGPAPSYSTLRRYMTAQQLRPAPRAPTPDTPGAALAAHVSVR